MALTPDQQRRMRVRRMNLLMAYASFASSKAVAWTPAELFAQGEQGVWYDPSDMTTLFQDAAGTTPVTAVEQPVGLMLDKSKGLALGPELVTNGTFDSGTGWTLGTGWSISGGVATGNTATTSLYSTNSIGATANKWYIVTYTVTAYTSGTVRSNIGSNVNGGFKSAIGTYTEYLYPTAGDGRIYFAVSNFVGSIDNISVRELPGNHASQSTSASRPVLSARVNLLTHTEDLTGWYNALTTGSTATKLIANNGSSLNSTFRGQTLSTVKPAAAIQYILRFDAKAIEYNRVQILFSGANPGTDRSLITLSLVDGSTVTSANVGTFVLGSVTRTALSGGGYTFTIAFTSDATTTLAVRAYPADSVATTGNGVSGIYFSKADLRPANDGVNLPAYQRVGAATAGTSTTAGNADYDTTGFPVYFRADGADDRLVTSAIDFSGTDKVTVFAGIRKLSDAARGTVVELTATSASNNGAFHLTAPNAASATYAFESKGTALTDAVASSSVAAPITSVLTGIGDIAGDSTILRVNGVQADADTGDQGTGNYANAALYIGSRGGTTLPFNGQYYGLIVRGAASSAGEIASAEAWMATKAGVAL